ncbi:MFS transporter [Herbihabitans rhizosphaerae]|uniref:MFS transporter n=1 Tax=Herbihabitans rhizosphaerae TaxID=1872711 RepID=A0A4Q7KRX8_9PSEU|nr:MFS transporter [Herbihabitans rhizosphaerae]
MFAVIALVAFVTSVDNTIVATAAPSIAAELGLGLTATQWVTLGYMLPFAGLLLAGGAVIDRWGARPVLSAGLAVFGVGAIVGGLAGSAFVLITGRAVQGAAAALVVPATLSLLRTSVAPGKRPTGVAIWTASLAVALAAGPAIGGAVSEHLGWSWIFFGNVPFAVAPLLIIARLRVGRADPEQSSTLAPTALALGCAAMVLGTAALVGLGDHAAYGPVPWTAFAGAALIASVLFVHHDRRSHHPIVPRSLLRTRPIAGGLVVQLLWGLGVSGAFFFTPMAHQAALGIGPTAAAVPLVLVAVALVLATPFVAPAVRVFGPRATVAAGLIAVAAGLFAVAAVNHLPAVGPRIPGLILVGAGSAFTTPLTSHALDAAPESRSGTVSGLLTASRELSSALGVALIGAVLAVVARGDGLAVGYTAGLVVAGALELLAALAAALMLAPRTGVVREAQSDSRACSPT